MRALAWKQSASPFYASPWVGFGMVPASAPKSQKRQMPASPKTAQQSKVPRLTQRQRLKRLAELKAEQQLFQRD